MRSFDTFLFHYSYHLMKKDYKLPVLLFAFANDKQTPSGFLDQIVAEREAIEKALEQIKTDGLCELKIIPDARLELIIEAFHRYQDRVVLFHFAGHANEYELILETAYREKNKISKDGFTGFLIGQQTLQFVFLNGCATDAHTEQLAKKIPHVITTQRAVDDHTAKVMAELFYKPLGLGKTVKQSFVESLNLLKSQGMQLPISERGLGRKRQKQISNQLYWTLQSKEDKDWSIPIAAANPLYLLPLVPKPFPPTPFPNEKPYTKDLANIFWGRDYEIRAFYDQITATHAARICLVYGASGVGKTSFLQAGVLPRLARKFEVAEKFPIQQETIEAERKFIFLDGVTTPHADLLQQIEQTIKSYPKVYIILSFRLMYFDDWKTKLKNRTDVDIFYLSPITQRGIRRLFKKLEEHIQIDKKIPEQFERLLLPDVHSPLTPLFQRLLFFFWKKAKAKNYDAPYLTWDAYEDWKKGGSWNRFILDRLTKVDQAALDSGLLLQLLKDCRSTSLATAHGIDCHVLKNKYTLSEADFAKYITALQEQRLLATSAIHQAKASTHIRLSHTLLALPLTDLLNESKRSIQEIQRWLHHHLQLPDDKNRLPKKVMDLIEQHLDEMPVLSNQAAALLNKSKQEHRAKQRRKYGLMMAQFVAIFGILLFGHAFNNPYLLLYIILLMVLFPWYSND